MWAVRQQLGIVSVSEGSREVRAAAERAVSLDSTLAEAHLQLANMRAWTDRDWSGAGREYRKAIQLTRTWRRPAPSTGTSSSYAGTRERRWRKPIEPSSSIP